MAYGHAPIGPQPSLKPKRYRNPFDLDNLDRIPIAISNPDRWEGKIYTSASTATKALGHHKEVIQGWLPATGVSILVASKGDGKTLALVDQSLSIATDRDWKGYPVAQGYFPVYLCGEFPELTWQHIQAWCKRHGVDIEEVIGKRFIFAELTPNLLDRDDVLLLAHKLRMLLADDAQPIIYIDTWQRATLGEEQIGSKEMGQAIMNAELLGKELGAPIVIAAHPAKGGGTDAMGSSVVGNATGAQWHAGCVGKGGALVPCQGKPSGTLRGFRVVRNKGTAPDAQFVARIEGQQIGGEDAYGRPYSGGILVLSEAKTVPTISLTPMRSDRSHLAVLRLLRDRPGISLAGMATELGRSKSQVQRDVEALATEGYAANPSGHYAPTDSGNALLASEDTTVSPSQ
jgi:hypothetical protein